jgi:trk system potassium uptake protein TrkH
LVSILFWLIGVILFLIGRKAGETQFRQAVATAGLSWIIIPLITTIPFMFISNLDFLSGFFESMSGWTTTGLTMVGGSEAILSPTIQFYRSFTQWLGGIGVVVLTVTILVRPGSGSYLLFRSEAREEKIKPSIISTVRSMWWMYIFYTGLGVVLLWVFGMPLWDALNHSMSAISTGGFAVKGASIGTYNSIYLEIIVIVLMCFGATAFVAHYNLLKGRIRRFFGDVQVQALIVLLIFGGILLTLLNLSLYDWNWLMSFRYSFFQYASSQTTTGFATGNIALWSDSAKLILCIAMIIGGAAGATAGGIKLYRFIILSKAVSWRNRRESSTPHRVFTFRFAGKDISSETRLDIVNEAAIIAFLWMICLVIGVFVLEATSSYSLIDNFFEVCSAQGNTGLSMGITQAGMNPIAKFMLIINMYIGRLEIIPVLMMIASIFRK